MITSNNQQVWDFDDGISHQGPYLYSLLLWSLPIHTFPDQRKIPCFSISKIAYHDLRHIALMEFARPGYSRLLVDGTISQM